VNKDQPELKSVERISLWQKTPYANLVRNQRSATYFARLRVNGKLIWRTLKTDKISVARPRLADFVKERRQDQDREHESIRGKMLVANARQIYEQRLNDYPDLKPTAKLYRSKRIQALMRS
jgi:hypothetical protein